MNNNSNDNAAKVSANEDEGSKKTQKRNSKTLIIIIPGVLKNGAAQNSPPELPVSVFAHSIIGFLSKEDICSVMAVKPLRDHFRLDSFFCPTHGSRLEKLSTVVSRFLVFILEPEDEDAYFLRMRQYYDLEEDDGEEDEEEGEEGGDDDGGCVECDIEEDEDTLSSTSEEEDVAMMDIDSPKLVCEDCAHKEKGRVRCLDCNQFCHKEDELKICDTCGNEQCYRCELKSSFLPGTCDRCHRTSCGDWENRDCHPVFFCLHCQEHFCVECSVPNDCFMCDNTELRCMDCPPNGVFYCALCENSTCEDCRPKFMCEICEGLFCCDCKDHVFRRFDDASFCYACLPEDEREDTTVYVRRH